MTNFIRTLIVLTACVSHAQDFHLKDGDRVVFYGDSITDQRLYTTFVETYVVTRFPKMSVTFVHSGWGGDRVTGGGGGGASERLTRDVAAYKPTVATIMLGMNDGRYRAFDDQIFDIYSTGYRQIVERLKKAQPGLRITAIEPSPYDDVTRAPGFPGGYNAVLLRYAKFIRELSAKEGLTVADLNGPVTAMLERAKASNLEVARRIIPDRVHPGAAGHLIMAESLLKAWRAPALVSTVELDAGAKRVAKPENSSVTGAQFGNVISWTQQDTALPMPVDLSEGVMALALRSSDFMDAMNRQILKVTGLAASKHTLRVDDEEAATFTAAQLAEGVNLAGLKTPMWAQAAQVHQLTLKHAAIHQARWRNVQVPLQFEKPDGVDAALAALDSVEADLVRRQRAMAQPKPHKFELAPGDSAFKPIFTGKDLSGWHISQVNAHGNTQGWKVENGAITGAQDAPKNGGILLTDRKYRNFEVSLEVNPDPGCDSGLFLRATEKGEAYQVLLDYLDGGVIGGIYGEKLEGVRGFAPNWQDWYRRGDWNHLRARIEGEVPRIQVWLNGVKITDWRDTENHLPGRATDGMIAVQVHGGNRWIPGGKHRFRNLAVRELR
ncbi:MAG: family 16 glycoside hydrolase [Bryobacteraceae bacterium]